MHGTYQPSPRGKPGARGSGDSVSKGDGAGRARTGEPLQRVWLDATDGGDAKVAERGSIYDEVTARIVAELEGGRVPWVRPWGRDGGAGAGLPRNAVTSRNYSGINVLILWGAVIERGYPSQGWLTFRHALAAGGTVRKGERGITVVYADRFVPGTEQARAAEAGDDPKTIAFLKRFTVFNVAQCEGLRPDLFADPAPLPEREIVPVAEEVIAASGVDFIVRGDRAFYVPALDFVQVPPQPAFFDQVNYYRTCLHELTHATGHASRLGRDLTNAFGTKDYAREELVAEMGSAFLCASLGIVPTVRHADYPASWLEILKEDNRAIFRAASAASKAADWLLARHAEARAAKVLHERADHARTARRAAHLRHRPPSCGQDGAAEPDFVPAARLFNPCGAVTWLVTEIAEDGDTLFGLVDLGFGRPELGSFSLAEIEAVRLPFGLRIERNQTFKGHFPLSAYVEAARQTGSIIAGERLMRAILLSIELKKLSDAADEGRAD